MHSKIVGLKHPRGGRLTIDRSVKFGSSASVQQEGYMIDIYDFRIREGLRC